MLSRCSIWQHAPTPSGPCAVESHLFIINSQPPHNPCNFTVSHTPFHSCRHVKSDHYHGQKDPSFLRSTKPKSDIFIRKPQASNPKTIPSNREPTNCMPHAAHDVPQTTNILSNNSTSLIPRNGSNALHATVLPLYLSPYANHSNSSNELRLTPYETPNELGADLLCVLDLPAADYQSQSPMKRQIPTTCTHYASRCNFVAKVICVIIVAIICPSRVVAATSPVSSNSASTCAGIFHTRSGLVPMIHVNECPSACVAVTCTADKALQAAVAVEITWIFTIRKSCASQITLDGTIGVDCGIYLVDGASLSLVNANTSNEAGFSSFYCNNVTACTASSKRLPLSMHVRDAVEVMGTSLIISSHLSSSHCMTFACPKVVTYAVGIEGINEPTPLSGLYFIKGCCYTALRINNCVVHAVITPQSARQLHCSDSHAVLRAILPPSLTDQMTAQHCSASVFGAALIVVLALVHAAKGNAGADGSTSGDEPLAQRLADEKDGAVFLSYGPADQHCVNCPTDSLQLRLCRFESWPDKRCEVHLVTGTSTLTTMSAARVVESMCITAAFILIRNVIRGAHCRASQRAGEPQQRSDDMNKSRNLNKSNPGCCRVVPHSIFKFLLFLVVIISLVRGGSAQQVRYVRVTADAAQQNLQISYLCVCDNVGACDENSNQLSKDKVATATSTYDISDAKQVTKGIAGNRNYGDVCHSAFFTTFPSLLRPFFHDFYSILAL